MGCFTACVVSSIGTVGGVHRETGPEATVGVASKLPLLRVRPVSAVTEAVRSEAPVLVLARPMRAAAQRPAWTGSLARSLIGMEVALRNTSIVLCFRETATTFSSTSTSRDCGNPWVLSASDL